ncbi:MAG: hypothetical protein ACK42H_04005, partial [Planctomycetota bacterium]
LGFKKPGSFPPPTTVRRRYPMDRYGGLMRWDLSQDPLRPVVAARWIVTVVLCAGIFRKIHYRRTDLPQRGIMR